MKSINNINKKERIYPNEYIKKIKMLKSFVFTLVIGKYKMILLLK